MDIDEDDDFYAPEEPDVPATAAALASATPADSKQEQQDDLEEGEEEDEGGAMDEDEDDSDIDIITERKDGTKAPPPVQSKYSDIRNIPQRTTSNDTTVTSAPLKKENPAKASMSASDAELPAVSTSKIDVNAIPTHKGTGKPITQVNIDEDLPENEKPWRKPGTDLSDYFNYGFDEFTWALYAAKQESLRNEYNQDLVAQNNKKMMEDINNMMMMGGMAMPGAGAGAATGAGGAGAAGAGAMPGLEGIPPEMQAMMQQMMASGMDPSQMDASSMSAMFAGMQNAAGGAPGGPQGGGQGQSFGGGQGGGFGGNQGQGYGYDQQGMGGGGNRGNFGGGGGRGRGGRRNW